MEEHFQKASVKCKWNRMYSISLMATPLSSDCYTFRTSGLEISSIPYLNILLLELVKGSWNAWQSVVIYISRQEKLIL